MRSLLFAPVLALTMACSTEPVPDPEEPPAPPPQTSATLWLGGESCQAGRVEGRLEMFANHGLSQPLPTNFLLQISVDGNLHSAVSAPRIRVAGLELARGAATKASELEVFAGFVGSCEWISLAQVR